MSPETLLTAVTCGPIIQEVVQGLKESQAADAFRESLLAIPRVSDPVSLDTYLQAAEIYRRGRRLGHTIRSSADCLIAAIAIENRIPVWHKDRDFRLIAKYTDLQAVEMIP